MVFLLMVWLLVTPLLLLQAVLWADPLFGAAPTEAGIRASHRSLIGAGLAGTLLPGLALALAVRAGMKGVAVTAGGVLGLSVLVLAFPLSSLAPSSPSPPAPQHEHCQEFSGSDNVCPGD